MIIIDDKLIHDDLISEQFVCNLDACKGACCWEGDSGAPLEAEELPILEAIYPLVAPFLTAAGRKAIEEQGKYVYFEEAEEYGATLIDNAACAYMTMDSKGVAQCGIEEAYNKGLIPFRKPISCHLYPVRVFKNKEVNFEALNYDRWEICHAACTLGAKLKIPVYQFVKEALIRKYGEAFYDELDALANHVKDI